MRHAHGYAIQTLSDLGLSATALSLPGFLAWLWAAVAGARHRVPRRGRARPERATQTHRPRGRSRASGLIFGLHSLVDWTWFVPGQRDGRVLVAGWVAGRGPALQPALPPAQGTSRILRFVAAGGLMIVALVAAWAMWQPLRSVQAGQSALDALDDGQFADAQRLARTAHDRNPLAVEPLWELAAVLEATNRPKQARAALRDAVKLQPSNPEPWERLATFELREDQPLAAVQAARAAIYLDPLSPITRRLFLRTVRAAQPAPPAATPTTTSSARHDAAGDDAARHHTARRNVSLRRTATRRRPVCWSIGMRRLTTACALAAAALLACAGPAGASTSQESQLQDDPLIVYKTACTGRRDARRAQGDGRRPHPRHRPLAARRCPPRARRRSPPASTARTPRRTRRDVEPLRRDRPPRRRARHRGAPQPDRARAVVGDRQPGPRRPRAGVGPVGRGVRSVRARRRAPLRRHLRPVRGRPLLRPVRAAGRRHEPRGAAPRRVLVAVERARTRRLARTQNDTARAASARMYRGLLAAGWSALAATGHTPKRDTILFGELAPKGQTGNGVSDNVKPLAFLRALYCVDAKLKPLSGSAATALGCPTSNQKTAFPAANPALFSASGLAHHPYALLEPPARVSTDKDFAVLADTPRLLQTLDGAQRAYGKSRKLPVWLTEYGYQTKPPDPFGVPPSTQAAYLNEAEYIAYRTSRIRSWSQFLLVDDGPIMSEPANSPRYWGTFQTGLIGLDGRRKPAYAAYRLPIFVPTARSSSGRFSVWGGVRAAPNGRGAEGDAAVPPRRERRLCDAHHGHDEERARLLPDDGAPAGVRPAAAGVERLDQPRRRRESARGPPYGRSTRPTQPSSSRRRPPSVLIATLAGPGER